MAGSLKVATFTVRADVRQCARWKQAAEAEGFPSVGTWLAGAADAYLKIRAKAGLPLPLAWRRHVPFAVRLEDGTEKTVTGWVAPPFGIYCGSTAGPGRSGCKWYTLVYLPEKRPLATMHYAQHCRTLGAELARTWAQWKGQPSEDPAPLLQRFQREDV